MTQLLIIILNFYCFGYCTWIHWFGNPWLFVNVQGHPTQVARPAGLRGTQFGKFCFTECLHSLVMMSTLYKSNNRDLNWYSGRKHMRSSCRGVLAVPCPTPSAAQQRSRFDPRPVCVGFVVHQVALGSTMFFCCQYWSTDVPYFCFSCLQSTFYNLSNSECQ